MMADGLMYLNDLGPSDERFEEKTRGARAIVEAAEKTAQAREALAAMLREINLVRRITEGTR